MIQTQSIEANISGEYVAALSIDGLRVLIPHHQVRTLEPVADVESSQKQNEEVGWIVAGEFRSPVFCFSRNLAFLDVIPAQRRIAVLLAAETGTIGILCDSLTIVPGKDCTIHPLPDCMKASGTPFTGLAIYDDSVCCLSSADHMLEYLSEKPQPPGIRTQS